MAPELVDSISGGSDWTKWNNTVLDCSQTMSVVGVTAAVVVIKVLLMVLVAHIY